ncbi:MAG: BlaI/MecI/CopY family transcriptional regulator [Gammaproteobacteria bacterium]
MSSTSRTIIDWIGGVRRSRMPDLGDRELAVLQAIWAHGESSAQQVQVALGSDEVTLSTVQSTLERLTRKGLLQREKHSRAYRYSALYSRSEVIGRLIRDIAEDLAGGDLAPMVSGFASYVATEAPGLEADLDRLIARQEGDDDD